MLFAEKRCSRQLLARGVILAKHPVVIGRHDSGAVSVAGSPDMPAVEFHR
jgi:hypothetical protein